MKFNLNLDYGRKPKEVEELANRNLTEDYISFGVRQIYKDGLDNQFRRTWGRIQRKLDAALEAKKNFIELEHAELDFIKRGIKDAKYPPDLSKYIIVLEDAMDKIKDDPKA